MDLLQNPFYILNASPFDNRAKLTDLADEHSLLFDSDESMQVLSILLNPRKRISAEIAWLPGVTPELLREIMTLLRSSPSSLLKPQYIWLNPFANSPVFNPKPSSLILFDINELTPVVRANILAAGLSRLGTSESSDITAWILELAQAFEEIKPDELMSILNEERAISGFPEVSELAAIESEIQAMRRHYLYVIKLALDSFPTGELVKVVTDTVNSATDNGTKHGLTLIDDMIDSYELEAQSFFEKEEENIKILVEKINAIIYENQQDTAVDSEINQLTKVLRNWNYVAQPININAEARGSSHKETARVVKNVRNLIVDILNNDGSLDFAKQITSNMREIFSEIKKICESLDEDMEALKNIHKNNTSISDIVNLIKEKRIKAARELIESRLLIEKDERIIDELTKLQFFCIMHADMDGVKPIESAPSLHTINGSGTTLYGESLAIVLMHIPIFWLARYSVTPVGDNTYSFHGKKNLALWQIIWNIVITVSLAISIISFNF